jgi:hypothetical protein
MCEVYLFADWVDEKADRNLVFMESLDDPLKLVLVCPNIQAVFGCQFPAVFGNEGNEIRNNIERYPDDFVGSAHFEIEFSLDRLPERTHIRVTDMAAIFPEVAYNAAGACSLADLARFRRVRLCSTAGISEGGNMIYINGQTHANLVKMMTDVPI